MPEQKQGNSPSREGENAQLVRQALTLLVAQNNSVSPDDLVFLQDDLLNWDHLVEVDFPREWKEAFERMSKDDHSIIRKDGERRARSFMGPRTLEFLVRDAPSDDDVMEDLRCASIAIGNLIENQVAGSDPKLASAVQRQVNALYNSAANQALSEGGFGAGDGKMLSILPEDFPRAPELDDEG